MSFVLSLASAVKRGNLAEKGSKFAFYKIAVILKIKEQNRWVVSRFNPTLENRLNLVWVLGLPRVTCQLILLLIRFVLIRKYNYNLH